MGVAVELSFDPPSEQALRQLQATLSAHGLPPTLEQLGFRPHLSLAVFADAAPEPLLPVLQRFAHATRPFAITFSHLGVFPTAEGVVFLAPTLTRQLASLHRAFHEALAAAGHVSDQYYQPDHWVPHCTIATDLPRPQVALAIEVLLQAFRPLRVQCTEIGLITFRPATPYASFGLGV